MCRTSRPTRWKTGRGGCRAAWAEGCGPHCNIVQEINLSCVERASSLWEETSETASGACIGEANSLRWSCCHWQPRLARKGLMVARQLRVQRLRCFEFGCLTCSGSGGQHARWAAPCPGAGLTFGSRFLRRFASWPTILAWRFSRQGTSPGFTRHRWPLLVACTRPRDILSLADIRR